MECQCGAGPCRVEPIILNPRFLFVCCPRGQADDGGCGFMQWRDTVDPNNITTWIDSPLSPSPPSTPPHHSPPPAATNAPSPPTSPPPLDSFNAAPCFDSSDAHPPTTLDLQDDAPFASYDAPPPPPPPQVMCPCGAGPCSLCIAKNGGNFYSCSECKFKQWCDAGSPSQCYICREEGHWSRDCPQLPPPASAAAANNKKLCFYCKQEDHYAAQCHLKFSKRRN